MLSERFALKEVVGAGPVGWVYRAEDRELGQEVALKLIRPRLLQTEEERTDFLAAIRGGRQFSHPQLARVYEEGEHGEYLYFTEPNLGGRNLRSVLVQKQRANQFFPLAEAVPLLQQIANALTAAHAVGVHGDVKPENIFLLPDALKLTDFGLALGIPREPFVRAQQGFKHGAYFSPEYVAGGDLDIRADVYALGVLMGELLGNVLPDGSIPSLRHANPELPIAVNGLYRRALNESREARPSTPAELMSELEQLVETKAAFDFPPAPPPGDQPLASLNDPGQAIEESDELEESDLGDRPPPPVPETAIRQETELVPEEELVKQLAPSLPRSPSRERSASSQWAGAELPTLERPLPPPDGRNSERRRRIRRTHSVTVLFWIALAGLGLGAAGGWLLLERLRQRGIPTQAPREEPAAGSMLGESLHRAVTRAPPRAEPTELLASPTVQVDQLDVVEVEETPVPSSSAPATNALKRAAGSRTPVPLALDERSE